jgi:hypothetical protein
MMIFKQTVGAAVVAAGITGLTATTLAQAAVRDSNVLSATSPAACSPQQHNHVQIMAVDNIWGAGIKTPPDPSGGGGGQLPQRVAIPPGTRNLTMHNVTGEVSWGPSETAPNGADGDTSGVVGAWKISATGGISGISDSTSFFYLVGVFLGKEQPATPPPGVDYAGHRSSLSFKPRLGQIFFIGDGLTGNGKTQQFRVPAGAKSVYLGFTDALGGDGPPGWYGDNRKSLFGTVRFTCK